jgi:hypothetical protein
LDLLAQHLVVLRAIATQPALRALLVLKGAHAAKALTQLGRPTRDIDVTVPPSHSDQIVRGPEGEVWLREVFTRGIQAHCRKHEIDWRLVAVGAHKQPRKHRHRFGWDGFEIRITLAYRQRYQATVELDLSLGDLGSGTMLLEVSTFGLSPATNASQTTLYAYTREQIIAEKLRAFLQKLEPHRTKIGEQRRTLPRVRDLHDITALCRVPGPPLNLDDVASLFREKCADKAVDCNGPEDFLPQAGLLAVYRQAYSDSPELAQISFEEAWSTTLEIVQAITVDREPPGISPLPAPVVP